MNDSNSIESICILRLSAIGDVCNAVAAVQAIQVKHPKAQITWIIGKVEYQLLKGLPGIEFIVFDKRAGKQASLEFKTTMKGRKFDVLLLMQVAMRANWLSRYIKATRRIGFDKGRSKELHSLFINERIQAPSRQHVLDGFMSFARHLGVDQNHKHNWNIPIENETLDSAQNLLPSEPFAVIVPSASNIERNWLTERYAAIADFLSQQNISVVLCGGPSSAELSLAKTVAEKAQSELTNLVGETNLKQLLAILGQAELMIAPDTGPLHMAVSQGTKVIGLYGHSNPARTGPYGQLDNVIEVYHSHLKQQSGKTAEQLKWGKRVKGDHVMQDILVADVEAQIKKLLS